MCCPPDSSRPGLPMMGVPLRSKIPPETARAPVEGTPVTANDRRCPVCSDLLRPRQRVCSGRCRAELSRRRQAEARQARDQEVRALLLSALALIGKGGAAV